MTKNELFDELKRSILTLARLPGSDLDEAQLSTWASLSRTPLREVLQRLAGDGYVVLRTNRGAQVSPMAHTTLRDFFLIAPMIYGAIHRLAALHATPEQLKSLRQAQQAFHKSAQGDSSAERALANNRFHQITGEMAGNVYLLPSFNRLLIDHARIGVTFFDPLDADMGPHLRTSLEQHDAIIEAIQARDPAAAARLATEHMELSRHHIERFAMPDSLQADADFERAVS